MFNLCRKRHLRQEQMLILGEPGTHKTNFVQALSIFLDVFFVPSRKDDFSGASNDDDVWVIDEFRAGRISDSTLLMILDGQKVGLDKKYGNILEKTTNLPIIMLTNKPYIEKDNASFWTRVKEVTFVSKLDEPIMADRLPFTIYKSSLSLLIADHGADYVTSLEPIIYVGPSPKVIKGGDPRKETRILCFPLLAKRRGRPKKWVNPENVVSVPLKERKHFGIGKKPLKSER